MKNMIWHNLVLVEFEQSRYIKYINGFYKISDESDHYWYLIWERLKVYIFLDKSGNFKVKIKKDKPIDGLYNQIYCHHSWSNKIVDYWWLITLFTLVWYSKKYPVTDKNCICQIIQDIITLTYSLIGFH